MFFLEPMQEVNVIDPKAGWFLMETVQGPCGEDDVTILAATRDVRGQRLTSGGRNYDCAERFIGQETPTTFYAVRSQERPPRGRSGAARRASRLSPGEGGMCAGLVPTSLITVTKSRIIVCPYVMCDLVQAAGEDLSEFDTTDQSSAPWPWRKSGSAIPSVPQGINQRHPRMLKVGQITSHQRELVL